MQLVWDPDLVFLCIYVSMQLYVIDKFNQQALYFFISAMGRFLWLYEISFQAEVKPVDIWGTFSH